MCIYTSIVIKVLILNTFSLLNVNKAVKEREEREGRGETERERKGDHGIAARRTLLPESRGPNLLLLLLSRFSRVQLCATP